MKKLLSVFLITIFSTLTFAQTTAIPDANFEQALIDLGYDTGVPNGSVPTANINSIGILNISHKSISDLTGINDFSSLVALYAGYNNITSIDVSQNTTLTALYIESNQLTNLDVTALLNLNTLNCSNNQLTNLDITQNINLTSLTCSSNQFYHLNITNNPLISSFLCHNNNLQIIDVSNQIGLVTLNCQNNNLLRLDVSNNVALKTLWCSGNSLTHLNVSLNPNLEDLYCDNNMLTCLNVKNGNNSSFTYFNATLNPSLTCINVDSINYAQSNWTNIDNGVTFDTNCANVCLLSPCSLTTNFNIIDNGNGNYTFQDISVASNDSIVSWLWEFGNGDTSSAQTPNFNYLLNGNYMVNLTVSTNNLCVGYFSQNLSVTSVLCNINAGFSYINKGNNNISFSDTSILNGTPPYSYFWDFTIDTTSVQNPNFTYNFNGDWLATLTVTDSLGCSDSTTQLISVNSLPCNTTFTYVDNGNGNFSFSSSPTGVSPIGYLWNFDDGTTAQGPNPTHTFTSNGTYAVGLFTQDFNNCETLDFDTVVVSNITCNTLVSNFTYIDNGNGNYTFTNTSTGSFTQTHWAFGDGTTSTLTNPTHTFNANDTFVVVLTINDSIANNTCTDYSLNMLVVTGVINPVQCAAGFVMFPDTNGIFVINSSTGTNLTYLWDFGDGDTSTLQFPSHTYATSGPYYLCLTINDGASCVDMYCDSIGENGVVFSKQTGFTINVIAPPLTTQVNEHATLNSNVAIYPNPNQGSFDMVLDTPFQEANLTIFDLTGKIIIQQKITQNNIQLNLLSHPKGMYFYQLLVDGKQVTGKIVLQ